MTPIFAAAISWGAENRTPRYRYARGVVARIVLALLLLAGFATPAAAATPRLKAFESCSGLVRYAERHAIRNAGEPAPGDVLRPVAAPEAGDDHSTTNVQEGGVDEPDTVKTDGRRLFVVAGGALHVIDARARPPRLLDTLKLPEGIGQELLLHGDRILVVTQLGGFGIDDGRLIRPELIVRQGTTLSEIAVSERRPPAGGQHAEADGAYLTARLTGPTARVVLTTSPRAVESPAQWLPRAPRSRAPTAAKLDWWLVRCRAVRRTRVFSGLEMVTVLTVDMEKGLPAVDADALMTDAQAVYASQGALYVATRRWFDPVLLTRPPRLTTAIHRFDTSERGRTVYRSSGEVPGYVLSQWALSEHAGHLRVASTAMTAVGGGEPSYADGAARARPAARRGRPRRRPRPRRADPRRALHRRRRLRGDLPAQRFTPDVVDLSDPGQPRVRGELKMLGDPAYLHPVGDDLLLGVGQDATEQGRRLGTQLSLFDVSDPARPRRLHRHTLAAGSYSAVEWDHRAFLYWPADRLAVVPVDEAAAGFRVTRAGIDRAGSVSQQGTIARSAVIGDRLFTVSELGVKASPLPGLNDGTWLPLSPAGSPSARGSGNGVRRFSISARWGSSRGGRMTTEPSCSIGTSTVKPG